MVHAMLDECGLGQALLSQGEVESGYFQCWLYGSRFDLATCAPIGPPATRAVPLSPVLVVGGGVEDALLTGSAAAAHG